MNCRVYNLSLINYDEAYDLQKKYVNSVLNGNSNVILLCEHPLTFTLGRLANKRNFLISDEKVVLENINIRHIDRGGDITLHAQGQLVVYPIFNLALLGKDLKKFFFKLEEVAIDLLNDFGIVATRSMGKTGVWVEKQKISSIGIGVRKWVSYHGISINVNIDLDYFKMIRPCGMDIRMTSIAKIKKKEINMDEVKEKIISHFSDQFNLSMVIK